MREADAGNQADRTCCVRVIDRIEDRDPRVRAAAVEALGCLHHSAEHHRGWSLRFLTPSAIPDTWVRKSAARVLGNSASMIVSVTGGEAVSLGWQGPIPAEHARKATTAAGPPMCHKGRKGNAACRWPRCSRGFPTPLRESALRQPRVLERLG